MKYLNFFKAMLGFLLLTIVPMQAAAGVVAARNAQRAQLAAADQAKAKELEKLRKQKLALRATNPSANLSDAQKARRKELKTDLGIASTKQRLEGGGKAPSTHTFSRNAEGTMSSWHGSYKTIKLPAAGELSAKDQARMKRFEELRVKTTPLTAAEQREKKNIAEKLGITKKFGPSGKEVVDDDNGVKKTLYEYKASRKSTTTGKEKKLPNAQIKAWHEGLKTRTARPAGQKSFLAKIPGSGALSKIANSPGGIKGAVLGLAGLGALGGASTQVDNIVDAANGDNGDGSNNYAIQIDPTDGGPYYLDKDGQRVDLLVETDDYGKRYYVDPSGNRTDLPDVAPSAPAAGASSSAGKAATGSSAKKPAPQAPRASVEKKPAPVQQQEVEEQVPQAIYYDANGYSYDANGYPLEGYPPQPVEAVLQDDFGYDDGSGAAAGGDDNFGYNPNY
jgi:hypothetical protein